MVKAEKPTQEPSIDPKVELIVPVPGGEGSEKPGWMLHLKLPRTVIDRAMVVLGKKILE